MVENRVVSFPNRYPDYCSRCRIQQDTAAYINLGIDSRNLGVAVPLELSVQELNINKHGFDYKIWPHGDVSILEIGAAGIACRPGGCFRKSGVFMEADAHVTFIQEFNVQQENGKVETIQNRLTKVTPLVMPNKEFVMNLSDRCPGYLAELEEKEAKK